MSQNNRSCQMKRKKGIVPVRQILHDKKNCTFTNTDNKGHLFVTVFEYPAFL